MVKLVQLLNLQVINIMLEAMQHSIEGHFGSIGYKGEHGMVQILVHSF